MRRRDFLGVLGCGAAAWPLAARAQQVGRVYRIGVFAGATNAVMVLAYRGFLDELRKLDFIEGQNLTVDRRSTAQTPAALSANPAARRRGDRIDVLCIRGKKMPMLRKLPKAYRARIESAASEMMRLHGEQACEIAREMSKKTRDKHQPGPARYWSLVALALSRINAHGPTAPLTSNKQADVA